MKEKKKKVEKIKSGDEENFPTKNRTPIIIITAVILVTGICFIVLLATGTLLFILPGTGGAVTIKDSTQRTLSDTGGEVYLGDLSINVPAGVIQGEGILQIGEVGKRSLPQELPKNADLIGSVYALEWAQGSNVSDNPVEVTFSYDPDDLPKDAGENELAIMSYDGTQWLRIPAEIDTAANTVTAEVSHFCLKALVRYTLTGFSRRGVADRTQTDIDVSGRVEYIRGNYIGDRSAESIPAGNLRFALIDTDGIVLYDGWLEDDGSFDFVIPQGTDVAIDLDAVIRVYAEDLRAGRVLNRLPPDGGAWWYNSEVQSVSLSSDRMDFFTITIPDEHSGAFNILDAIKRGQAFSPGIKPDPVTVVWPGTTRGSDVDSAYDEDLDVIFLSKKPQTAWDADLILRMYGEYVHHWLILDNSSLFCSGNPKGPEKKSNDCRAWQEGFGYFYSAMVRGDEYYEIYKNSDGIEEEFNLENGAVAYGPRSAGTVSQVLWDMTDGRNDGENVVIGLDKIFNVLFEYGTSIDSITSFYNFWSMDYIVDREFCQLFADYEILDMEECEDLKYQPNMGEGKEETQPDNVEIPWLEYGDGSMGSLETYQETLWRFTGHSGDVITITVKPLDEGLELDLLLIDAYDDFIAFGEGSPSRLSIEQFTLPADGKYLINVASLAGEGDYTISLDRAVVDATNPAPNTTTPTSQQATATQTLTRTGTQAPSRTPTFTMTALPSATLTNTSAPTLPSGPTGGTIQLTIIVPQTNKPIALVCIQEPITNWDDVSVFDSTKVFDDPDNPIEAGNQLTIEVPAGVWTISAWTPTLGGYNLYDAEMQIDLRYDTEWGVYKNPRWN